MIPPTQKQEIGVVVYENGQALSGIEPDLIVYLPDGRRKTLFMFATDQAGQTSLTLDPIEGENSEIVEYEVCIRRMGAEKFCVRDSFVIWQTP